MSEHIFVKTERRLKNGKNVYRCEKCNSEVAFSADLSVREVNQAVQIKWPKFVCIAFKPTN